MYLKITNKITIDAYKLLLLCAFFYNTILNYVTAVLKRLPYINMFGEYIIPVILIFLLIIHTKKIKLYKIALIIIGVVVMSFCCSYFFFSGNKPYFIANNIKAVFLQAIPFLILGINFEMKDEYLRFLARCSYLAIIVNFIYLVIFTSSRQAIDDNMHWAYLMLMPTMFSICDLFNYNEKKWILIPKIVVSIMGAFYIISMGSRGPILIILVYFGILLVRKLFSQGIKRAIIPGGIICIIIALVASGAYLDIIYILNQKLISMGLSTRAISLFLNGEYVAYTSGRDQIYEILWQKIYDSPFLGYGMFGEWQFVGYSAHNIYLELCMHFGLFAGTIIAISCVLLVINAYRTSSNKVAKELILLFFVFTVVRGIFGGDYLSDYFFFLIGISIKELVEKKNSALQYSIETQNC